MHRPFLLLALVVGVAPAEVHAASGCALDVQVVDEAGAPVAGTTVRITLGNDVQSQSTGPEGTVRWTSLPCREALIEAGQPQAGWFAVWGGTSRELRPASPATARIVVVPRTDVTVRVLDDKRRPVPSGLVHVASRHGEGWSLRPDQGGIAKAWLQPGPWSFEWQVGESAAPAYPPNSGGRVPRYAASAEAEIGRAPQVVDLVLAPGERLEGRVLDPDGQPLPGVHVFALKAADGEFQSSAESMTDGRFVLSMVDLPTVLQPASFGPSLVFDPPRLAVQEMPSAPLQFVGRLGTRPILHGRVVRKGTGESVAEASIHIVLDCGGKVPEGVDFADLSPQSLKSDADGTFDARCAPECPFKVTAYDFGRKGAYYPSGSASVDVPAGACDRELVIELERRPTWVLEGTVTDRKGAPLEGLPLILSGHAEKTGNRDAAWYPTGQRSRTGENGRFRLEGHSEGRFRLHVQKESTPKALRDLVLVSKRAPGAHLEVTMGPEETKTVEVHAVPGATVCAHAVDARNAPVTLDALSLYAEKEDVVLEQGRIDGGGQETQGRFCIEGVVPSRYRVLLGMGLGTLPTWYPGTAERAAAVPVDVVSGMNELDPVVLRAIGRVGLTVRGWSGSEPPFLAYRESRPKDAGAASAPSPWTAVSAEHVKGEGEAFVLFDFPVGRWDLRACGDSRCSEQGGIWSAGTAVDVRQNPVAEVALGRAETTSLFGVPLFPPAWPSHIRQRLEADLEKARDVAKGAPDDPDALIWVGRRTAFLWQFRDAVAILTQGTERWPQDPRFLRHRGHRLLNLRKFDEAIADLTRAEKLMKARPDEVEEDGRPDAAPTHSLYTAVWYHLGIARFAKAEFEPARLAFASFLAAARNDDARMIATEWLYLTLRRMGRHVEATQLLAQVPPDGTLKDGAEPRDRLLFYRGERTLRDLLGSADDDVEVATHGFGVAQWYLAEGRKPEAEDMLRRVTDGEMWALLPRIAAEAELVRLAP